MTERGEIDVKGKGTMKTYWLDYRENRRTLAQSLPESKAIKSPIKALEYNYDRRMSMPQYMLHNNNLTKSAEATHEERRVYSPITFEDVARRSIIHSPIRHPFSAQSGRVSRSNSTGHAYIQSPSDVFGSLIVDTEEFLEDLQNRNSAGPNSFSPLSTPMSGYSTDRNISKIRQISARIKNKKKSTAGQVRYNRIIFRHIFNFKKIQFSEEEEVLKLNQRKPSPSAPILQKNDSKDSTKDPKDRMKRNSRFSQVDSEKRALENLDEMVKSIDSDIPGMCWPISTPPPNSHSEGNLRYLQTSCK